MKKLLSSILVLTMLFTMFIPVSFAGTANYELKAGAAQYDVTLGDAVEIPFNFKSNVDNKTTGLIQFKVAYDAAMGTPTYTLGSLTANDAVTVTSKVIVFEEKVVTHTGTAPLFTLSFTPAAAGTYDISITDVEIYTEDFDIIESIDVVGTKVVVSENTPVVPEPPVVSDADYELKAGAASYDVALGTAVDVPFFFKSNVENKTTGLIQFKVAYPEAMGTPTYTLGSLTANDAVTVTSKVIVFEEKVVTHDGTTPLFTLHFAPTTAGTYNVEITDVEIYTEDFDTINDVAINGATVTVTAGTTPEPPVVTLEGITVAPTAIEIPYGTTDVKAYVEDAITEVKASYSDGTSAAVTGYAVAVDANLATVTYEGKTATIALTFEPAPVVLEGITVAPAAIEIPYGTENVKAYVEDAITEVKASYSDGTTTAVTGYEVAVSENLATVTFEGKTATIALTYEEAPVVPEPPVTTDADYELTAAGTYEVALGTSVDVPFFFKSNVENKTTGLIQFKVAYPEAMGTPTYTLGALTANDAVTVTSKVIVFEEKVVTHDGTTPLFTLHFAPTVAGTYTLDITDVEIYTEDFDTINDIAIEGATITVTAGTTPEPPVVTLEGITVAPATMEIPYGTENDAKYVGENITITAAYSDGTTAAVTEGYHVEVASGVATVTYEGKTATIALTYEAAPVVIESISASPAALVIPYGTADAIDFVRSNISVTAAMSDGSAQPVANFTVQINNNDAIITYEGKETTVALTYVNVARVESSVEEIVVPYGTEDVDAYIEANVGTITVVFTDGSSKVATADEYTVSIDPGSSAAVYFGTTGRYVKIPVHVVTLECVMVEFADEENEDRTIVLPYDLTDETEIIAFIKNALIVTAWFSNAQEPVVVDAADYSIANYADPSGEASYTVSYNGMLSADNFYIVRGAAPVEITGINVVEESIVIPYGTEDITGYIKANINVKTLESDGGSNPVTAFEVALDGNVATVTYEGFTDTLRIIGESVEEIYADVDDIEIPYTVASDEVINYIKENIKVYVAYSHNTPNALVNEYEIALEGGVATITVGIFTTTIEVTFEPVPEYFLEVVEAVDGVYGVEGAKLLIFNDVMAGKAIIVNGAYATYVGNNKYAYVATGEYQIATEDMTAVPVAVEFGKLHDENVVTAFDALLTLNKGLGKDVAVFDNNVQNYILADIDGDGVLDATDAQMINNMSLGKTVNTWVDGVETGRPSAGGNSSAGGSGSTAVPVIPDPNLPVIG